ncbi:methyltransferase domain-containing protein [Telmatocola sphagniphila]|uniref:Methyltransferase domain-containing protein n=1 Tax=Telmatocola sphagniphila TaxID=1123043 RepID=A0A8E6B7Y6_9BACT|nr:methyltransferase [Telmatocola sphagniphila]QVL32208.1 methyltransferase domain-containing protein [Telmatocola sphagniphila]
MNYDALSRPATDPVTIFEHFRGNYATELLTAAIVEFQLFDKLRTPKNSDQLRQEVGLKPRPFVVLTTALRAMGLLQLDTRGDLSLTPLSQEHLLPGGNFFVGDYVGLAAQSPGVRAMIERLKTNRPAGGEDKKDGAAFIFREGVESAMEDEQKARHLTLALAGRAKNVAPHLAAKLDLTHGETLLDIGGGTGIYSIACLQKYPRLKAIIYDRPEVLKVPREMGQSYGVAERMEFVSGDMFADSLPLNANVILLSNILHDWDVPECRRLIANCVKALPPNGQLVVHDVFLNDALDGPLAVALYSAALFTMTEGRAYSVQEYTQWMTESGLRVKPKIDTLIHAGFLTGLKSL